MRPPHFVITVATVVLSGSVWLGLIEKIQGQELAPRAAFVLAKNDGAIDTAPVNSHTLLPAADGKDAMLLLLIGASLFTIAAGMRRCGSALAASADACPQREASSTCPNDISVTRTPAA
jgi:hypothetical protein